MRRTVVRRSLTAVSFVALSVGCAGSAFAWSARGHMMVGDIAAKLLTPTATEAVSELLRDDLGADGKASGRSTLAQVSVWPDELRATPEQRATGAYHFDDVPICGVPDKAKYCPDGLCGTVWFKKQIAVLKDRSQPLHASDNGDRGGNDVEITFLGKRSDDPVDGRTPTPYNLHTAWDRLIPYKLFDDVGGYDRFLADMPSAQTRADWEVGDMDQWAAESFFLARDFVYAALPLEVPCGHPPKGVVPIDAHYDGHAEVIAAMQLRKAGVRLAKVLNDVLSTATVRD